MADSSLCDDLNDNVILLADGSQISARRSLLQNVSDYFSAMFSSGMTESQKEQVEIKEVAEDCLQTLVHYSNTGTINVEEETVERLLAAAVYLQFPKIVSKCCDFLKSHLKAKNCLKIRNIASDHFHSDLKTAAHSFVLANFLAVVKTEEFLQLSSEDLKDFLKSDILMVNSEDDVYEALVFWLDSNKTPAENIQADLVKTVRLPFLSPTVIDKAIANSAFQSAKEKLAEIKMETVKTGWRPRKTTAGILLAIGIDGEHIWDVYDPVEDAWKEAGTAAATGEAGRYVLAEEILYYVGGVTYDDGPDCSYLVFSEGKWCVGPKLLQGRNNHGAVWLEGAIFVVGGQHTNVPKILDLVEKWQLGSNKWQYMASLPAPKGFFGLTVLGNKMYAVGGNDENYGTAKTVFCYHPHRDAWTTCASLNFARSEVGVGVLDGAIYAAGGNASGRSGVLERYDPRIDKWEILPEMTTPRSEPAVSSLAGELFVVGGQTKERRVGMVEIYDPSARKWRMGSPLQSSPEDLHIFNLPRNTSFFRKSISV